MKINPEEIYHVYNHGNNRQRLFYEQDNYHFFLRKLKRYISPHCDILAYCLMPNHFHLLIHGNEKTIIPFLKQEDLHGDTAANPYVFMTRFAHGMKMLLSSYAKAINKRHNRSGSLFRQNTKAKCTSSESFSMDYSLWCFIYIHNNPMVAGLAKSPQDWAFSSYKEYSGECQDPLCNIQLARKLLSLDINELGDFGSCEVPEHIRSKFF
jgi:REP element-mobilizing transposase RayT